MVQPILPEERGPEPGIYVAGGAVFLHPSTLACPAGMPGAAAGIVMETWQKSSSPKLARLSLTKTTRLQDTELGVPGCQSASCTHLIPTISKQLFSKCLEQK